MWAWLSKFKWNKIKWTSVMISKDTMVSQCAEDVATTCWGCHTTTYWACCYNVLRTLWHNVLTILSGVHTSTCLQRQGTMCSAYWRVSLGDGDTSDERWRWSIWWLLQEILIRLHGAWNISDSSFVGIVIFCTNFSAVRPEKYKKKNRIEEDNKDLQTLSEYLCDYYSF